MMIRQHKSTLCINLLSNLPKTHILKSTIIESFQFHSQSHIVSAAKLVKYFLSAYLKHLVYHRFVTFILSDCYFCPYSQRR